MSESKKGDKGKSNGKVTIGQLSEHNVTNIEVGALVRAGQLDRTDGASFVMDRLVAKAERKNTPIPTFS